MRALVLVPVLGLALVPGLAQRPGPRMPRPEPAPGPIRPVPAQAPAAAPNRAQGGATVAASPRPATLPRPVTQRIVAPRALPRCTQLPGPEFWKRRDLSYEIQLMARRGFVPVLPSGDAAELTGASFYPAGWCAYGFVVPAGGKLHVRLHHPNEGWFRLAMVDRWGQGRREGMLQNLIPTGNPEVSYANPGEEAQAVFVIVDDPGWMSTAKNPFTLKVERSWDPARQATPALPPSLGVWAEVKAPAPEGPNPPASGPDRPAGS